MGKTKAEKGDQPDQAAERRKELANAINGDKANLVIAKERLQRAEDNLEALEKEIGVMVGEYHQLRKKLENPELGSDERLAAVKAINEVIAAKSGLAADHQRAKSELGTARNEVTSCENSLSTHQQALLKSLPEVV